MWMEVSCRLTLWLSSWKVWSKALFIHRMPLDSDWLHSGLVWSWWRYRVTFALLFLAAIIIEKIIIRSWFKIDFKALCLAEGQLCYLAGVMPYLGRSGSSPLSSSRLTKVCTVVLGRSISFAMSWTVMCVVVHSSLMWSSAGRSFASCFGLSSVGWYGGAVRCGAGGAVLTVSVGVVVLWPNDH